MISVVDLTKRFASGSQEVLAVDRLSFTGWMPRRRR